MREIAKTRVLEPAGRPLRKQATTAERLGLAPPGPAARAQGELAWDSPPGWQQLAPTSLRQANFRVPGEVDAECYLTVLAGDGGGLLANVNRWREQMGRAELSAGELAQLERIPMLGSEGHLVSIDGDYQGTGAASIQGARLLGAVCLLPERAFFVKLVGPSSVVERERDSFVAFCQSLKEAG